MDKIQPLISIIVPVYNVEEYVEECVLSIENQTWVNRQIILVDDGSTDESGDICDKLQLRFSDIQVIHKENGGLASARNAGLDVATGEYVGFIDSDDYIEPDMYERLITSLLETNSQVACCSWCRCLDTESGREIIPLDDEKKICHFEVMIPPTAIKSLLLNNGMTFSACDKLFKSDLFGQERFPNENLPSEDIPCIYSVLTKCKHIVHIGEDKYIYRIVKKSISNSKFESKNLSTLMYMDDVVNDVCVRYPELKQEALFALVQSVASTYSRLLASGKRKEFKNIEKKLRKIVRERFMDIMVNPFFTWKSQIVNFTIVLGLFPMFCKVYYRH